MPISDQILTASINNDVRPNCEAYRNLTITAAALAQAAPLLLARLERAPDDEVVDDGRLAEGIPPPTVGDLRAVAGLLQEVLPTMTQHPAYPVLLKLCVRLPKVG